VAAGAVHHRWVARNGSNVTIDVVASRDDAWRTGADPFSALVDAGDGSVGQRIATGRFVRFNDVMGQERLGGDLAIAVDPSDPASVYVTWCDRIGGATGTDWTVHVRHSTDSGQTWSGDIRTVTNAKNPALAVSSRGHLGFVCQQFTGTRWVTQLEITTNDWATPRQSSCSIRPRRTCRRATSSPYLGDYMRLVAVGEELYGVFSGNNTPDAANFPSGVAYQRAADWTTHTLLNTDGVTPVAASIDPFFFKWSQLTIPRGPIVRDGRVPITRIPREPIEPRLPREPIIREPRGPIGPDPPPIRRAPTDIDL